MVYFSIEVTDGFFEIYAGKFSGLYALRIFNPVFSVQMAQQVALPGIGRIWKGVALLL